MGYLVLARKYRPKSFQEVVGQEHVATTLKNAIRTNHLAHAYLFSGPRGVGKTTMARILAKSLNCELGPTGSPCNQCSSCLEIAESRSMDVYEIDGASNRGIDEIRNLRENVRYVSARGRYKIYIIDEVHMLTTEAFNALLKTLEEPPEHVLFIFATTEPQKVISTILSRCQRFDFRRLRIQEIVDRIRFIAKEEGIEIDSEADRLLAQKADGSMRDGESMLDQLSSFTEGRIRIEDVRTVLGFFDTNLLHELTDRILHQDGSSALNFIENLTSQGIDDREFLPEWIEHFRTLLHVQHQLQTDRILSLTEVERRRFEEQASRLDTGKLLRMLQIISETENQMKKSDHPRILLESCIVRLVRIDSTVHLKDLLERMEKIESIGKKESIHSEESLGSNESIDPKPPENPKPQREKDLNEVWKSLLQMTPKNKKGLAVCLQSGDPTCLEGDALHITFPKDKAFAKEQVEEKKNKTLLEEILKGLMGRPVRIECEWNERPADSIVEKAAEIFEAELVS